MIWRLVLIVGLFGTSSLAWRHGVIGLPFDQVGPGIATPVDAETDHRRRRIVILGASLANRQTWIGDLAASLRNCAADTIVQPLARAGANSGWGRHALVPLIDLWPPDIVVVQFAGNDASLLRGVPLSRSEANLRAIIAMSQAAGALVFVSNMSPAYRHQAIERPGLGRYQALYRRVAFETGAGLIDTVEDWHALSRDDRYRLMPDGLHPTPDAHQRFTLPAFRAVLTPWVCPAQ